MDWRHLANQKEKYQAYLCSAEWGTLRSAVRLRSGGMCEKCRIRPMDHVHHQTYIRKYSERLTDLLAVCEQCHSLIHGHADPVRERVVSYAVDHRAWVGLCLADLSRATSEQARTQIILSYINWAERARCKRESRQFKPMGWIPETEPGAGLRNLVILKNDQIQQTAKRAAIGALVR